MKKFLVLLVVASASMLLPAHAADPRPTASTLRHALSVDGVSVGLVRGASGGTIQGEVAVLETEGGTSKHLSTIHHEPLSLQVGLGMGKGFFEWVSASLDKGQVTKSAALLALNENGQVVAQREFVRSHIEELRFPDLDAGSKDPAWLDVVIRPETIRYGAASKSVVKATGDKSKAWLASNFRVEIGDLPCERVSRVDAFTWKQTVASGGTTGAFRMPAKTPAKVEVPNLKLTLSTADLDAWAAWHKTFVIDGKATDADEQTGSITLLAPDLVTELGRLELGNVGILSLSFDAPNANPESIPRFSVELYVEKMGFEAF